MYAQLGNVRFEGLRGFTRQSMDSEARYAELALLDGKARLQRTGSSLLALSIDILLRRDFTNPLADYVELDDLREAGEVLPLLTGDGNFIGNFVITKMAQEITETDTLGIPVAISLGVELKEFIDPNPEATKADKAKANGFATSTEKVVPVRLQALPVSPMAITSTSVKASTTASTSAIANVQKSAVAVDQQQSLLNRAAQSLKDAQNKAQTAIKQLQDFASLEAIGPGLLATVQNLYDNAGVLAGYIAAGDLTNALTQSDALAAAVGTANTAIIPLNSVLIKRGPQ